jgi:hypothetical protein
VRLREVRSGARQGARLGVFLGALLGAASLAGCATLDKAPPAAAREPPPAVSPVTRTVRIYVPRPVKCVPEDLGPPPAYPDSDEALRRAGGAADRYQLLAAGRILREERLRRLEEVVSRCRKAAR